MADETESDAASAATAAEHPGAAMPRKPRSPAAERALAEAAERRAEVDRRTAAMAAERHGRKGPEPVRYGDWEKKGLASDF